MNDFLGCTGVAISDRTGGVYTANPAVVARHRSGASGRSLSWLNSAGERLLPYHALRITGIDRYRTMSADYLNLEWLRFDGAIFWTDDDEMGTHARHRYEKAHDYDSHLVIRPTWVAPIRS